MLGTVQGTLYTLIHENIRALRGRLFNQTPQVISSALGLNRGSQASSLYS